MFHRILVPLDGSELAERALVPAAALCRQAEGELTVLRVSVPEEILVPDIHSYGGYGVIWPDQALERSREEAAGYLRDLQARFAQRNLIVHPHVLEGDVAECILDSAAAERADLIVMSSHGYSGLTRWLLGSVAEKVLRSAPCPVLVIRSERPLHHVLIPLDGSAVSEQVLLPALEIAASLRGRVTLLRAAQRMDHTEVERLNTMEAGLGLKLQNALYESAEEYLRGLLARHAGLNLPIETGVVSEPAAASILKYAESHDVDLIAMSTHGRTGLQRWVYGSVTEKILRGGQASMLIVRPAL